MPRIAFPGFCGGSNLQGLPANSNYLPLSAARSINLYPEKLLNPVFGSDYALIGRPGLSQSGFPETINRPVRALWAGQGRLFAVGGTQFYELSAAGGIITDHGAMPSSTGIGPASIMQNQGSAAFTLTVWDSSSNQLYYASGGSMHSAFNATFQEYLDGFSIAIATGASLVVSGNPNQVNTSAFGDPTNWTPGPGSTPTYVTITGGIGLLNGLATLNGMLWIFAQQGIEIWYDAGNAGFPLQRYQGATIKLGYLSGASIVKFYNTVVWLGGDSNGDAQVYMANGMQPVRVSTAAIEGYLALSQTILSLAWGYGYQEAGRTFYCLNLPASGYSSVTGTQIVYDLTEGLWHERTYGSAWPCCFASVPENFSGNGLNFVGDFNSGKVMFQGLSYGNDLGANGITYTRYASYISDLARVTKHRRFELLGESCGAAPNISYSNDFGKTFNSGYNLAAVGTDQGWPANIPSFRRFYAWQLGRSRARVYKLEYCGSCKFE